MLSILLKTNWERKKKALSSLEKELKFEEQKLTERRKGILSFSNYKIQQQAQKEIESAAKLLRTRESEVYTLMEEVEKLDKARAKLQEQFDSKKELYSSRAEQTATISEEQEDITLSYEEKKGEITKNIPKDALTIYNRVITRSPVDPTAYIKNGACSICAMTSGPQITMKVLQRSQIMQCPGCKRILTGVVQDPK